MKRAAALLLLLLAGCTTHPVADVLDYFAPGRVTLDPTPPTGGVCIPQGGPPTPGPQPIPVPVAPVSPAMPVAPVPTVPPPPPSFPGMPLP